MRLYKGVLHGIEQGTSGRPVAAAADNPPRDSAHFLFGSDKVPEKRRVSLDENTPGRRL